MEFARNGRAVDDYRAQLAGAQVCLRDQPTLQSEQHGQFRSHSDPRHRRQRRPAFADLSGGPRLAFRRIDGRLDLTQATAGPTKVCVTQLKLDVGPLSRLPYTGRADQFDVFVINTRATGFVGLASADRAEPAITFVFAKPVCPSAGSDKGESSYFFGFAAAEAPREVGARVKLDSGETFQAPVRAPAP